MAVPPKMTVRMKTIVTRKKAIYVIPRFLSHLRELSSSAPSAREEGSAASRTSSGVDSSYPASASLLFATGAAAASLLALGGAMVSDRQWTLSAVGPTRLGGGLRLSLVEEPPGLLRRV